MIDFRLLRHLSYFLAVAEERHFGRAANRLGITQPPLSAQIQVLERVLGVSLFDRTRTGAHLTPAGKAILPSVRRLTQDAQKLELIVREVKDGRMRHLRIGAVTSAMFYLLPAVFRQARTLFPDLTFSLTEMDTANALGAIERDELDLAFVRAVRGQGSVKIRPLSTVRLAVALPLDHRLTAKSEIRLSDLSDETIVMFPRRISPAYYDDIIGACARGGFSPRVMNEVQSIISQLAFVGCGAGIALVPGDFARVGMTEAIIRPLAEVIEVVTLAAAWNDSLDAQSIALDLIELAIAASNSPEAKAAEP